jgi:hypothetical protein
VGVFIINPIGMEIFKAELPCEYSSQIFIVHSIVDIEYH